MRTVLLYNKGNEYVQNNWRPIALANTIYKLWTDTNAECTGTYADQDHSLCSSQEGFMKDKNVMRQLQNLMNIIRMHQDLYIMCADVDVHAIPQTTTRCFGIGFSP